MLFSNHRPAYGAARGIRTLTGGIFGRESEARTHDRQFPHSLCSFVQSILGWLSASH